MFAPHAPTIPQSHAPPYVIRQPAKPQIQPQAHLRRLHPINACPNCLIEHRRRVHSFGQRRIPSWRRWELAPAACYMVAGEEPALIRSQHPCAQDALHELPLAGGQAQLLLILGLSDASHLHSAGFHLTTLANDPSSPSGSAKRCATAKSHGIRSRWDWA